MPSTSAGGQTQPSLSNQPTKLELLSDRKVFFPVSIQRNYLLVATITLLPTGVGTGDNDTTPLDFFLESSCCFAFLGLFSLTFEFSYCAVVWYMFSHTRKVSLVRCQMARAVLLSGGKGEIVKAEV